MKIVFNLLLVLILSFLLTPVIIDYFHIDSLREPGFKAYRSDEASFVKTLYLMERGQNYYSAFRDARVNLLGGIRIDNEVLTYRLPTIFYIWTFFSLLGSTSLVLCLFIFFSLFFLYSIYMIVKKLANKWAAVFSVLILLPYFYDTFKYGSAFLFIEWWGLFFFVYGSAAFIYKHNTNAAVLLSLSVCIRELFIIPIFFWLFYSLIRKKDIRVFLIPTVVFTLFYLLHYFSMVLYLGNGNTSFSGRVHAFSKINLLHMLSFSMRSYVIAGLKSHYLLFFLGIIAVIFNIIYKRSEYFRFLALAVFSFIVVLPMISIMEDDYWGIIFMPLILSFIPLLSNFWKGELKR